MEAQTLLRRATFSVGICAISERENTLRITRQILTTFDLNLELNELVVATPNRTLAESLKNVDGRIRVLFEEEREGKAAALNKIFRETTGDVLVLASADTKLERSSVHRLVRALAKNESWGLVDSRVELVNDDKLLMDRISRILWRVHNATLDRLDGNDRLGHVAGDLIAIRRSLVDSLPRVINDDAYLALSVQQKGFRVKRVRNALVWIAGPRTPADYVIQRSRVLSGHLQLIRLFGKMPSTLEFMVLKKPRQFIRLFVETIAEAGHRYLPALLIAGFLEIVSLQMALISSLQYGQETRWRMAETTKRL